MKHLATIQTEFMKYSCCGSDKCAEEELSYGSEVAQGVCGSSCDHHANVKKQASSIGKILFVGDSGYGQWFAAELKRQVEENHTDDIDPNHNEAPTARSFDFHITTESDRMPQFLNCGQECPYLEYQGNPTGEYRGTPWCSLFKKDLSYNNEQGTEHPRRSSECVSAVEGLM